MPARGDSRSRRYRDSPKRETIQSSSRRSESPLRSRPVDRRERYNEKRTHRVDQSPDIHRRSRSPGVKRGSKLGVRSPVRSYSGNRRRLPPDQYTDHRHRSREDARGEMNKGHSVDGEVHATKNRVPDPRRSNSFSNEMGDQRSRSESPMRFDVKSKRSRTISISPRPRSYSYRASVPRRTADQDRSSDKRLASPDPHVDDGYHSEIDAHTSGRSHDFNPRNLGPEGPSVMVRNLSYETSPHKLRRIFSQWGQVIDVYVPLAYGTGRPRGFGFVEFSRVSMARRAVHNQHHKDIDGRNLLCQFAQNRRKSPSSMKLRGDRGERESGDRNRSRSRHRGERRHSPDRRR